MESSNTPLRVAAIFSAAGKITPKWFELNRRKHEIKETTYFWQDRVGAASRLHYAVSDGEALYELVYNSCDHTWTLTETLTGG